MGEGHRCARMVDGCSMTYWGELFEAVRISEEKKMSEKWYLDHMGVMAFWRTILGGINLVVAIAIALKVFEVI